MALSFEEKQKIVMKLNKRMRDIINKTGFNTAEFSYWENRIDNLPTTAAYTKDDQEYHLLSRAKKDIESYTDEELQRLESTTRSWRQVKEKVVQSMQDQKRQETAMRPDMSADDMIFKGVAPTMKEINQFLQIRKTINEWFDENQDLVYSLLLDTGWEDINAHSTKEIYEKVTALKDSKQYATKQYTEEEKDVIRAQYRARRAKMQARISLSRG